MAKYTNTYAGKLGIPGEKDAVKPGAEVELSDEQLKNEGVKGFIKSELLVPAGKVTLPTNAKTKKREGLEAQAAKLEVAFSEETTDAQLIELIKVAKK